MKDELEREEGIPSSKLIFRYKNRILDKNYSFSDYFIPNNGIINIDLNILRIYLLGNSFSPISIYIEDGTNVEEIKKRLMRRGVTHLNIFREYNYYPKADEILIFS